MAPELRRNAPPCAGAAHYDKGCFPNVWIMMRYTRSKTDGLEISAQRGSERRSPLDEQWPCTAHMGGALSEEQGLMSQDTSEVFNKRTCVGDRSY